MDDQPVVKDNAGRRFGSKNRTIRDLRPVIMKMIVDVLPDFYVVDATPHGARRTYLLKEAPCPQRLARNRTKKRTPPHPIDTKPAPMSTKDCKAILKESTILSKLNHHVPVK